MLYYKCNRKICKCSFFLYFFKCSQKINFLLWNPFPFLLFFLTWHLLLSWWLSEMSFSITCLCMGSQPKRTGARAQNWALSAARAALMWTDSRLLEELAHTLGQKLGVWFLLRREETLGHDGLLPAISFRRTGIDTVSSANWGFWFWGRRDWSLSSVWSHLSILPPSMQLRGRAPWGGSFTWAAGPS